MTKKRSLIIGISGMDGESIARFLLSKGYDVIGTYRKNTFINTDEILESFDHRISLEYCDITDFNSVRDLLQTVLKTGGIDEIYLLAAQSHVGNSFNSPEATVICNGMAAYNFLENIRVLTPKTKTYFPLTSEVLGGDPTRTPFTEESIFECRSPYAIGKQLGAAWVKYYYQTFGVFATYGILFNHSNCNRGKQFFIRKVTNAAAQIALGKIKQVSLGNLNFYRDEHWSDFGMEFAWKMLQQEKPTTYIVCRGQAQHGEEFLDAAFGYFNLNWKKYVKFDSSLLRPNEVVKLVGNPQKAIDELGWRPNRMSFKNHVDLMCAADYTLESGKKPARPNVFELFP